MKMIFFSLTIAVFHLFFSSGIQAQEATKNLDQLKLAQKYLVGTWQTVPINDTIMVYEATQHGWVLEETDYIIVNGKKSIDSFWSYSFKPSRNNFCIFAAFVSKGYATVIGSFTSENKWHQVWV